MKKILLTIIFSIITSTVNSQQINGVVQQMNGLIGLWHFNAGTGTTEYDPISKTVMTNNGAWISGIYGNALSFTSASSQYAYINTGASFVCSSITVCFWLYLGVDYTWETRAIIYRKVSDHGWHIGRDMSSTVWTPIGITTNNTSDNRWLPNGYMGSSFGMNISKKWVHLAVTYDSKGSAWYLNGVLKQSSSVYWGGINNGVTNITISNMPEPAFYVTASFDELAIFDRAITATEVKAIYNSGKSRVRIKK